MKQRCCIVDYSKLQGLIKEKLKTNGNLADKVHISRGYLSNIFNNRASMDQNLIISIANVLGIEPDDYGTYFFTRKVCTPQTK